MKVYLVNDVDLVSKMKRLIKLKADLGLCAWYNDFSDSKFDVQELIDATEAKLEAVKAKSEIIKDFTDDEDMAYFEAINSDEKISRLLETGIIDCSVKEALGGKCPSLIANEINKVTNASFIWIV